MGDLVNRMIQWENGEMTEEEVISLFQELVDNGMAWTLQGIYGKTANDLIGTGLVRRKEQNDVQS